MSAELKMDKYIVYKIDKLIDMIEKLPAGSKVKFPIELTIPIECEHKYECDCEFSDDEDEDDCICEEDANGETIANKDCPAHNCCKVCSQSKKCKFNDMAWLCADCQKDIDDEIDTYSDEEEHCVCDFPKFKITDGIQSCEHCGKCDHYKNGIVDDWSDEEEIAELPVCEKCEKRYYQYDILESKEQWEKWYKSIGGTPCECDDE
jgi:hypothetical protein